MKTNVILCASAAAVLLAGCGKKSEASSGKSCCEGTIKLITLDPGHFHAALVQKRMYPGVSPTVHVYAPEGNDLKMHMDRINGFNTRAEEPTAWKSEVYTGADFFEKMLADKAGNVVVLAGNNARKTEYILKSVQAGYNVLADKPMAITPKDFELLKQAFDVAREKGVMLYDIMTERYEITTLLQRELSRFPKVYGEQEKGTPDDPAVTKESVHHFCKLVAGKPLQRDAAYVPFAAPALGPRFGQELVRSPRQGLVLEPHALGQPAPGLDRVPQLSIHPGREQLVANPVPQRLPALVGAVAAVRLRARLQVRGGL